MKKLSIIIAMVFAATAFGCGKKDEKKADQAKVTNKDGDKAKPVKDDKAGPEREHRNSPAADDGKPAEPVAHPSNTPTPVPPDPETEKLFAEFGPKVDKFMKDVVAAVAASGGDCAKLSAPAVKLFTDNAEVLATMAKTNSSAAAAKWKAEHAELMKSFGGSMGALLKCAGEDKSLATALANLPKGP